MQKLLLVMLLSVTLFAQSKMEYGISLLGMKMDYKEYDSSGILLDSESSNYTDITGAEFFYRYFTESGTSVDFNVFGLSGTSDYTGSYLAADDGYGSVKSTTNNDIYDVSLSYNFLNLYTAKEINLFGGVGLGYRFWQRELSALQVEQYTWYSIRANIGVEYHLDAFSSKVKLTYEQGIDPEMSATGFNESFQLSSANIIKLSVPLRYSVMRNLDLRCEYVYEYQKIKESDVLYDENSYGYLEPDSKAYNQYIKIGIVFKY